MYLCQFYRGVYDNNNQKTDEILLIFQWAVIVDVFD